MKKEENKRFTIQLHVTIYRMPSFHPFLSTFSDVVSYSKLPNESPRNSQKTTSRCKLYQTLN